MTNTTTQPVLSANDKLRAALEQARSKSLPEYAHAVWAKRGVR